MNDLNLRIEGMLGIINNYGASGFGETEIENLERIILDCNELMKKPDAVQIADSIFDTLYDMLKQVNPDSLILQEIWEDGEDEITDYTEMLKQYPMMSIETAKSYECKELMDYIDRVPDIASYFASYKINGHGVRVVYYNGELVSATSRARGSKGRDLTRQLRIICGRYKEELQDYGLVEFRGEVALPFANLAKAREFNPEIKSAFSGVSSMLRDSASDEEVALLDFLCYGFLAPGFSFSDREEEFQEISRLGFITPEYTMIEECSKEDLPDYLPELIKIFEDGYEDFGYFCDGVVFEVNDKDVFNSMGIDGNHRLGNIALKVGIWEQVQYCGFVQKILWTKGKVKLSPVAIVADESDMLIEDEEGKMVNWDDLGVLTAQGNKVRRVPLYEPKNILILDAYVGNPIWFRYGGEAGVVPCFSDGRLLKEDTVKEILTGEYNVEE